ncbi:N-acetylmuramoyl-L-alanine amidase [Streptomyces calidiresistens]|uniref:N-acetylmuramoyl-L-alanine amidase n=2 Tax=Streptomyces calidiresistens TaxID=1485586 RepID=A0A7W3T1M9_9ACTN|nr:N-acetylmuramoyl-L-alanine amidase [Streptomyces calidiresistens]
MLLTPVGTGGTPTPVVAGTTDAASSGAAPPLRTGATTVLDLPTDGDLPDGIRSRAGGTAPAPPVELSSPRTEPFSLLGLVWPDPTRPLLGEARARTRSALTGEWSEWHPLDASPDHGPPAGEGSRGGTAPLWVGPSDGVEVRVAPETSGGTGDAGALPDGLALHLVDPGEGPEGTPEEVAAKTPGDTGGEGTPDVPGASVVPAAPATGTTDAPGTTEDATPVPGKEPDDGEAGDGTSPAPSGTDPLGPPAGTPAVVPAASPVTSPVTSSVTPSVGAAPRPRVVDRAGWGADESLREPGHAYTGPVETLFVHHTAQGNDHTCAEAPAMIRAVYRYHVGSQGWRDLGYNFLVDRCGTLYEGRAGGVDRPVLGAHTLGFNHDSAGVAVIGSYGDSGAPRAVIDSLARLAAWKLGLSGIDPAGSRERVSEGGSRPKGSVVRLRNVSGHRDAFTTECPGTRLYDRLPDIRAAAARLQGR